MELRKTSENNNRNFDAEGNVSYSSENANYSINDSDGNEIGSISLNVSNGSGNANICINGVSSITEGETKVKALLGIQ